jgi:hypothetical protein
MFDYLKNKVIFLRVFMSYGQVCGLPSGKEKPKAKSGGIIEISILNFYVSGFHTKKAQKCNGNQRPFQKRGESEKPYE